MATKHKQGKGGKRKVGRNLDKCKRYRDGGRREKNKARRLAQRVKKYEHNHQRRINHGESERQSSGG